MSVPPTPPERGEISLADLRADIRSLAGDVAELRDRLSGVWKSHLSVEEFAAEVKRAPYTVRHWIRQRRISAERISGSGPKGRLLIPREELQRVIFAGRGEHVTAAGRLLPE